MSSDPISEIGRVQDRMPALALAAERFAPLNGRAASAA